MPQNALAQDIAKAKLLREADEQMAVIGARGVAQS